MAELVDFTSNMVDNLEDEGERSLLEISQKISKLNLITYCQTKKIGYNRKVTPKGGWRNW
ncbi:hypothetical protein FJR05_21760 [Dolichospermum sp. UHCC 0259]|nr:hypothetical protein [Dolichospermum sp. UHCC 0259]